MKGIDCRICALALIAALLAGCGRETESPEAAASVEPDNGYDVTIRWTEYGIPHVEAGDWASLGYGLAYSVAEDAVCVLAEEFVTVRGERARWFGPGGDDEDNVAGDVFQLAVIDADAIAHQLEDQPPELTAMHTGYVDGYNRWLTDHANDLPERCADAPWVQPITAEDATRMAIWVGIRYGVGSAIDAIAGAAPPGTASAAREGDLALPRGIGSNAYAIGGELTANGRGLLLGNPHYPWTGPSRFHMKHLTIPGEVDVMGVGLYTSNAVAIGFTRHIAWTHTVSSALRFTLYRLDLLEDDPGRYRYGDETRALEPREVTVQVRRDDGSLEPVTRTVWFSHFGPVLENDDLPWTDEHAFAIRDVNIDNNRAGRQYLEIWRAQNVAEIRDALADVQGIAWVNTIAADRDGGALYADITAVPDVDEALLDRCGVELAEDAEVRAIVLDGSRPDCEWRESEAAAAPGLLPPDQLPSLITRRYVTNSNDSYWLSSPAQPLTGFSPIIGDEGTPRSLRTRAGLTFVQEVIDAGEKFTPRTVQSILFSHRNYAAELLLDDVLTICESAPQTVEVDGQAVDPHRACAVLADWDRTHTVDSHGAHVWTELWRNAITIPDPWAVPFDVEDPVNTPAGLRTDDPAVASAVIDALAQAVATLDAAKIPLDARLGDIQYVMRNGEKIGIPGGQGWAGAFSVIGAELDPGKGYTPVIYGDSYIQVVTWDDAGSPQVKALLTYSQSQEPDSPHYADQTRLYSKGKWVELPFERDEIVDEATLREVHLTAPRT